MLDFKVFDIMCRHGLATDAEILKFSRHIAEMNRVNRIARAKRREKVSAEKRLNHAVDNYRVSMAPRFGLGCSLPQGDRA